jgi:6-phosphogluconolactonase (cycloisomerase 2 family)
MFRTFPAGIASLAALVVLAACSESTGPDAPTDSPNLRFGANSIGAVYTSTNASSANEVLVYPRAADGTLSAPTAIATGGAGAGAGLGSQGAVVLSGNARWLLVVNAGSNDVSVFRADNRSLTLTDVEPSGGEFPVSLTIRGRLVYVLNAGSINNVTGFLLRADGDLVPLAGSTRPLSAASVGPAQVEFTPDGRGLVITEKATNLITTFSVERNGQLGRMTSTPSATPTPFGFAFDLRGNLIVSEAAGGAAGASDLSSYAVMRTGSLGAISPSVATTQSAACWVLIAQDGRLAFTTNTASGSVSAFAIGQDGSLSLLHAVAANTGAGSAPIDMARSRNGRFVYVLAPGAGGTVRPYSIEPDGQLTGLGPVGGVPATAFGLAAR